MSDTHEEWEWLQGELIIASPAGAEVAARLNATEYAQLRSAMRRSGYQSIEFVRKAIEHYVDHWVGPDGDQDRGFVPLDQKMDTLREDYRGFDVWITEELSDPEAGQPTATIGVHLEGDEIEALFSLLKPGESSVDFVREAVLALVAERAAAARATALPEAGS